MNFSIVFYKTTFKVEVLGMLGYLLYHPKTSIPKVIKRLIQLFTDEGDVVIDPVAGSGITLKVAREINRSAYGFEVDKKFYEKAQREMLTVSDQLCLF